MVVTDPFEGAETHAVARIRAAVAQMKLAVMVWEPRPMPANFPWEVRRG